MIQTPGFSNLWTHCLTQGRRQRLGSGCIVQQRSSRFSLVPKKKIQTKKKTQQSSIFSHRTFICFVSSRSPVRYIESFVDVFCENCLHNLYLLIPNATITICRIYNTKLGYSRTPEIVYLSTVMGQNPVIGSMGHGLAGNSTFIRPYGSLSTRIMPLPKGSGNII